jgi:hypothetical protein
MRNELNAELARAIDQKNRLAILGASAKARLSDKRLREDGDEAAIDRFSEAYLYLREAREEAERVVANLRRAMLAAEGVGV